MCQHWLNMYIIHRASLLPENNCVVNIVWVSVTETEIRDQQSDFIEQIDLFKGHSSFMWISAFVLWFEMYLVPFWSRIVNKNVTSRYHEYGPVMGLLVYPLVPDEGLRRRTSKIYYLSLTHSLIIFETVWESQKLRFWHFCTVTNNNYSQAIASLICCNANLNTC